MEAQLRARLTKLRRKLLDIERGHLRDTVLRISGAIRVLEKTARCIRRKSPEYPDEWVNRSTGPARSWVRHSPRTRRVAG